MATDTTGTTGSRHLGDAGRHDDRHVRHGHDLDDGYVDHRHDRDDDLGHHRHDHDVVHQEALIAISQFETPRRSSAGRLCCATLPWHFSC